MLRAFRSTPRGGSFIVVARLLAYQRPQGAPASMTVKVTGPYLHIRILVIHLYHSIKEEPLLIPNGINWSEYGPRRANKSTQSAAGSYRTVRFVQRALGEAASGIGWYVRAVYGSHDRALRLLVCRMDTIAGNWPSDQGASLRFASQRDAKDNA